MDTPDLSTTLQFWLLLTFAVLSLICSTFTIYCFLSNRKMRHGLHNHSILFLIITNVILIFTDVLWMLISLYQVGPPPIPTTSFCLTWWVIDDSLYNIQAFILAWASIERHLLIFHSRYITTQKQKFLLHYLPPLIIIIYLFSFHIHVLVFPSCENSFDFTDLQCGSSPCYVAVNFITIWDTIVNNVLPTLIIVTFNVALLYRIIRQKKRLRQPIQWRKHRRMSMQLISVSAVYVFLHLPMIIITFIQMVQGKDPSVDFGGQMYVFIATYSVTLSLPVVVCVNFLSLDKHRHVRISPTATVVPVKKWTEKRVER
ncbi:unnamed protein product [Adineta ricciae]|uniref:G-protein coupled receptors family 1 profile domain-containing protein n=1 Tax=Adineta ricciae TaxID=249248 RepID=A0A815KN30_ADIRI|nr:unnamed protein product [Adineta ricciae]CAF1392018.1 unnamed protein product [Adineta ricciae]